MHAEINRLSSYINIRFLAIFVAIGILNGAFYASAKLISNGNLPLIIIVLICYVFLMSFVLEKLRRGCYPDSLRGRVFLTANLYFPFGGMVLAFFLSFYFKKVTFRFLCKLFFLNIFLAVFAFFSTSTFPQISRYTLPPLLKLYANTLATEKVIVFFQDNYSDQLCINFETSIECLDNYYEKNNIFKFERLNELHATILNEAFLADYINFKNSNKAYDLSMHLGKVDLIMEKFSKNKEYASFLTNILSWSSVELSYLYYLNDEEGREYFTTLTEERTLFIEDDQVTRDKIINTVKEIILTNSKDPKP